MARPVQQGAWAVWARVELGSSRAEGMGQTRNIRDAPTTPSHPEGSLADPEPAQGSGRPWSEVWSVGVSESVAAGVQACLTWHSEPS